MHMVIEALGGTVIDYAGVYKCCGFPIITMNKEASLEMAGRHLGDAIDAEADCLVVPCPLCHLNLDLQQPLGGQESSAASWGCRCSTSPSCRSGARPGAQGARDEQARRQADARSSTGRRRWSRARRLARGARIRPAGVHGRSRRADGARPHGQPKSARPPEASRFVPLPVPRAV